MRGPLLEFLLTVGLACTALACQVELRIGERVLVEYGEQECAAFIVERKGKGRVRVHFNFEGYDWEEDVSLDRVQGKLVERVRPCSLPSRVRLALGVRRGPEESSRTSPFRVGERVRVKWRGSVYAASVVKPISSERILVHYLGHEKAWDETIDVARIVTGRR